MLLPIATFAKGESTFVTFKIHVGELLLFFIVAADHDVDVILMTKQCALGDHFEIFVLKVSIKLNAKESLNKEQISLL